MRKNLFLPAIVFGLFSSVATISAQQPETQPSQQPGDSQAKPVKPKKVWTEDDMGKLSGPVSVVGATKGSSGATRPKNNNTSSAHQQQVNAFRERIQDLQKQIESADKKIAELRDFKGENTLPSQGHVVNHGFNPTPISDQIQQLEEKKKQLQGKIDEVADEARRKGIEPGEIR